MKKNQTILKTVFLFLFSFFLWQACRNETVIDSTQDNFPQKYKITIINNNKILDNTEIVGEINKFKNKLKKSSRTVQDSVLEGAIIKTENILLIETEKDKTYTLPIARTYETSKVENLVLKKKTDGKYSGVLIQYNLTPEEKIKYATGQYVDLKSKIKIFDIRKLNISARVQTDIVGCYEITWETGEPEFVCVHEPKCYGGATKPIDIFSISNICDSGGSSGDSGGNHSESGVPGGNDGGFSNGGGSGGSGLDSNDGTNIGNTSPLIIDEWRLFPRLDSEYQSKYNTLSHEIKLFISIQFANQLNLNFSKWSIDFFIQNPNTSWTQFQNWFSLNKSIDADLVNELKNIDSNKFAEYIQINKDLDSFDLYLQDPSYNPLDSPWLKKAREYAQKLENWSKYLGPKAKAKAREMIDNSFIYALNKTAKELFGNVENLSETQKQSYFQTDGKKGVAILLYEFANGLGKDRRDFSFDYNITQQFLQGKVTGDIRNDFLNNLSKNGLTYNQFIKNGNMIKGGYAFSPDHTTVEDSFNKHYNANWVQFFIGGANAEYYPSNEYGWIRVVIWNQTTRNSLMLHQGENYDRDGSGNNLPLSTIKQYFSFKLQIY